MEDDRIVIAFKKDGEIIVGHAIIPDGADDETIASIFSRDAALSEPDNDTQQENSSTEFKYKFSYVERQFRRSVSMYRDSVIRTISISPMVSSIMIASSLGTYAKKRGEIVEHLSSEDMEVYKLPRHTLSGILMKNEEAISAIQGARYLPQIAIIGLISAYDAFISDLLSVIFREKSEIIFTSDREIKFSELVKLESIDQAKEKIIADEIETVLRKSHHEQFSWMEKKFSIRLRENLSVWPDFIELCERRNLLTHTGGAVSHQYIDNCKENGVNTTASIGDILTVDLDYLERAIGTIAELGTKLTHTLWRKFKKGDQKIADFTLNEYGMELIKIKKYKTAERLLEFAVAQKSHHSDKIHRMMIVNLANCIKLSGDIERAKAVLAKHDWTATSPQFQICVAAVKDDNDEVCRLIRMGERTIEITTSDFRDWPVFREARKNQAVAEAFHETFGEPLFRKKTIEILDQSSSDIETEDHEEIEDYIAEIPEKSSGDKKGH